MFLDLFSKLYFVIHLQNNVILDCNCKYSYINNYQQSILILQNVCLFETKRSIQYHDYHVSYKNKNI